MIQSNIIHAAHINGVKKLMFLGSSCIYPKLASQPLREDYLLTGLLEPTNEPYAIAKIAGIKMCESYNLQYGTNFISVMPTNLYGPHDNFDLEKSHVLPALIRKIHLSKLLNQGDIKGVLEDLKLDTLEEAQKMLNNFGITSESVEIWGTGKPMREFLWSEDMADACIHVMRHTNFSDLVINDNEIRNTHINIGTGKDISIGELANLIKRTIGYQGIFIFNSDKPNGTMKKVTDVSKIHQLNWVHKVELEEGISRIYDWYLSNN